MIYHKPGSINTKAILVYSSQNAVLPVSQRCSRHLGVARRSRSPFRLLADRRSVGISYSYFRWATLPPLAPPSRMTAGGSGNLGSRTSLQSSWSEKDFSKLGHNFKNVVSRKPKICYTNPFTQVQGSKAITFHPPI